MLLAAGSAVLSAPACVDRDDSGEAPVGEAVTDSTPALRADAPADSVPAAAPDDPFAGFELDAGAAASREERRLALRLRNHDEEPVVVYADGGAGAVLLDTVAAGSEARVDITTRAPVVSLRSLTAGGDSLRTSDVAVGPDTVIDVVVGSAADP